MESLAPLPGPRAALAPRAWIFRLWNCSQDSCLSVWWAPPPASRLPVGLQRTPPALVARIWETRCDCRRDEHRPAGGFSRPGFGEEGGTPSPCCIGRGLHRRDSGDVRAGLAAAAPRPAGGAARLGHSSRGGSPAELLRVHQADPTRSGQAEAGRAASPAAGGAVQGLRGGHRRPGDAGRCEWKASIDTTREIRWVLRKGHLVAVGR